MNGSYQQNSVTVPFTLTDVKVLSNYFTANGKEYNGDFSLSGHIVANRARLIKRYKGSSDLIVMHLKVSKGMLSGIWMVSSSSGPVSITY